jgi:hypothetical protein
MKILIYLVAFVLMLSCSAQVPNKVSDNFTFCYDSATYFSNSPVLFNGFYFSETIIERTIYSYKKNVKEYNEIDTIYENIAFFKDGVFARGFKAMGCGNCDSELTAKLLLDVQNGNKSERNYFYNGYFWGLYKIKDDQIIAQCVNNQTWPDPYWSLLEFRYRINDDNSVQLESFKELIKGKEYQLSSDNRKIFKFYETNNSIPSNTWLKNQKWFWCDEKQYNEWKNRNIK